MVEHEFFICTTHQSLLLTRTSRGPCTPAWRCRALRFWSAISSIWVGKIINCIIRIRETNFITSITVVYTVDLLSVVFELITCFVNWLITIYRYLSSELWHFTNVSYVKCVCIIFRFLIRQRVKVRCRILTWNMPSFVTLFLPSFCIQWFPGLLQ